jgi:DNA-binding transcriptional LysR family regulator
MKHFRDLELKLFRGTASEIIEHLKRGDAELGLAASPSAEWDRLDTWPLFQEHFRLVVNPSHGLAKRETLAFDDIRKEKLLTRSYCEQGVELAALLRNQGFDLSEAHEVNAEPDLLTLLDSNIGFAFMPCSVLASANLKRVPLSGFELQRTVYLYGVAGRQRTAVAGAAMTMLRAYDWKRSYVNGHY